MSISNWPAQERPREKLLQKGANALSDAELLAIFLRTGTKGYSAIDLARNMLQQFGDLRGLLDADKNLQLQCKGFGLAKYVQLQASLELSRRYLLNTLDRQTSLHDPQSTKQFLIASLRHHQQEVFAAIFLDNQHRIIQFEILFYGTIDCSAVHPREVTKKALQHNAAAVILAHNHPSGIAKPSEADIDITLKLVNSLKLVEVRVLDHMIVGDGEIASFAELGLLPQL